MSKTSASPFEKVLSGGHPNSLGNTLKVVEQIIMSPKKIDALFQCYFSRDEVVRMRTSNGLKRLAKIKIDWLIPFIKPLLFEISKIEQASTQWTLAELFQLLYPLMDSKQKSKARAVLKKNLVTSSDWIVLNNTMETLTVWAESNARLKSWMHEHLLMLKKDERKSVAGRADKFYRRLYTQS